ncbi:hypothetical protein [Desulfurobacterium sp.]
MGFLDLFKNITEKEELDPLTGLPEHLIERQEKAVLDVKNADKIEKPEKGYKRKQKKVTALSQQEKILAMKMKERGFRTKELKKLIVRYMLTGKIAKIEKNGNGFKVTYKPLLKLRGIPEKVLKRRGGNPPC